MKIIYNNIIPFKGFKAINLFGIIFVRKGCKMNNIDINHEKEYEELKRKKDADKGMAMIYMMCVTLLWPIVLIKNLFFNNVK